MPAWGTCWQAAETWAAVRQGACAVQVIRAGTYDQIFGPGSTPGYSTADAVYKYADSEIVQTEAGYQLNFSVRSQALSPCTTASLPHSCL